MPYSTPYRSSSSTCEGEVLRTYKRLCVPDVVPNASLHARISSFMSIFATDMGRKDDENKASTTEL